MGLYLYSSYGSASLIAEGKDIMYRCFTHWLMKGGAGEITRLILIFCVWALNSSRRDNDYYSGLIIV
jgi:hypothetical protein